MMPENRGQRIRELREHAGLSQAELASSINASRSLIAFIESGERTISDSDYSLALAYLHEQIRKKARMLKRIADAEGLPAVNP